MTTSFRTKKIWVIKTKSECVKSIFTNFFFGGMGETFPYRSSNLHTDQTTPKSLKRFSGTFPAEPHFK